MPEVQTYIQGITVGGYKIADEEKLKQHVLGWEKLIELVSTDTFVLSKKIACSIQAVIAKDEALEIGQFRSGQVGIAGTEYMPPARIRLMTSLLKCLQTSVRCMIFVSRRTDCI